MPICHSLAGRSFFILLLIVSSCKPVSWYYFNDTYSTLNSSRIQPQPQPSFDHMAIEHSASPLFASAGDETSLTMSLTTQTKQATSSSESYPEKIVPETTLIPTSSDRYAANTRAVSKKLTGKQVKLMAHAEGDPKKNIFATLGLIFIIGGFALAAIPGLGLLIIPGIIFSIIGLKSEYPKRAKAGLYIFGGLLLVGILILLLFGWGDGA
jgi:hypothetical protein